MKDVSILKNNGIDVDKSLELFGDMTTYDDMLEDFLKEVDGKLENAKRYKEASDMANYAIIVHSLKSDCRYFGMDEIADMFYEHELAGKRNDLYFVQENYDKLVSKANEYINILKRYMGILVDNASMGNSPSTSPQNNDTEIVLVVDDSNIIRNFIEKILDGKYRVICASDGEEAISIVDNTPKEKLVCMFLDLNMPGIDGFQVLEHFRNANLFKYIPVSIITGQGDKETVDRAFSYPIIDMIQKPFDEERIRNVLEKTISRKNVN